MMLKARRQEKLRTVQSFSLGDASNSHRGFTYLAALFAIVVLATLVLKAQQRISIIEMRDRERQLLEIGDMYRQAIARYYEESPGTNKQFPTNLDDLLEDRRATRMKRYIRKLYSDPVSNMDWGLVMAPDGGVSGVYSKSPSLPLKEGGFSGVQDGFNGSKHYYDWKFVYQPVN